LSTSVYSPPQWNTCCTKSTRASNDNILTTISCVPTAHRPLRDWLKDGSDYGHTQVTSATWGVCVNRDFCITLYKRQSVLLKCDVAVRVQKMNIGIFCRKYVWSAYSINWIIGYTQK
jgi:hypothetical protein